MRPIKESSLISTFYSAHGCFAHWIHTISLIQKGEDNRNKLDNLLKNMQVLVCEKYTTKPAFDVVLIVFLALHKTLNLPDPGLSSLDTRTVKEISSSSSKSNRLPSLR